MTTAQVNDFHLRHDPANPFRDPALVPVPVFRFPWTLFLVTWMIIVLVLAVGMLAGMTWTLDMME